MKLLIYSTWKEDPVGMSIKRDLVIVFYTDICVKDIPVNAGFAD